MPIVSLKDLLALDVEYAQFNALKTVGDPRESAFSVVEVGPLTVTRDRARDPTYYNRIVGCTRDALPWLDRALKVFDDCGPTPRIDVDMQELRFLEGPLRDRGFVSRQELIWLVCRTNGHRPSIPVVRLVPKDAQRIFPLLELQGPVDPDLWAVRCHHHCTEALRTFAIEADDQVVAMATSFVGAHGVVLGNAFTREDWRGRGFQSALIAARLADAAKLGVGCVMTDVEPHTMSLRNCERLGFKTHLRLSLWERAQ